MSFHIREAIERLPHLEKIDSIILGLRWLALALVFVLSLFDRSSAGVLVPALYMVLAMAGYNLLIFFLRYPFAWPRHLLNVLALDIYLKVYISCLRSKLEEDPRNPEYILTERGVGYWFRRS